MKRIVVMVIFMALHSFYAQSSALKEALQFYPLNYGNYWEYGRFMTDNGLDYPIKPSYWLKVFGDTLLPNGKIYKKIKQGIFISNEWYWRFERIDSNTSSVFRAYEGKEYKIDSLLSKPGDKIICSRFYMWHTNYSSCLAETDEVIFDKSSIVKTMKDYTTTMAYKYKLVKGIGYYYSISHELTTQGDKLMFAKIDGVEYGTRTSEISESEIPNQFQLHQNYPNPYNPITNIDYSLDRTNNTTLEIYDNLGRLIEKVINSYQTYGKYSIQINMSEYPSGIYYYKLVSGSNRVVKKMLLLK